MEIKYMDGKFWVHTQLRSLGSYEELKDLKLIIEGLEREIAAGEIRPDVSIQVEVDYGLECDHSEMYFIGYRLATDAEIKASQEGNRLHQEAIEKYERAEFQRLSEKFKGS